jgi:conserved oligomeric Golgi complex subunit 1
VSKAGHSYTSWYHVIDDVKDVVEVLRKQRWDNDYDEIEDEETIEARQQMLSKDDPRMLQEKLDNTLDKSFQDLDKQLKALWDERVESRTNAAMAMYILRVIRDIRNQMPDRAAIRHFGFAIVPSLHTCVALKVCGPALIDFESSGLAQRAVISRPLWEGEPPLPSQPSPQVFLFLRNLSHAMGDAGMDIWTPAGVAAVKRQLDDRLSDMWSNAIEAVASQDIEEAGAKEPEDEKAPQEDTDEESKNEESEDREDEKEEAEQADATEFTSDQRRDLHVQWLYDVSYLRSCIGSSERVKASNKLQKVEDLLWRQTNFEGDTPRQRISKAARDYWERTSLLFGLLA